VFIRISCAFLKDEILEIFFMSILLYQGKLLYIMAVVKLNKKKALEKLQARLTLRLGRKITQQETLDYCVLLASQNFDQLVKILEKAPILTQEKVERFLEERSQLSDVPYNPSAKFAREEDNDIYNM
jgi:hypothetical protein